MHTIDDTSHVTVVVPYESVVSQLEADTVSVSASVGVRGGRFSPGLFPQSVVVSVKVCIHDTCLSLLLFITESCLHTTNITLSD